MPQNDPIKVPSYPYLNISRRYGLDYSLILQAADVFTYDPFSTGRFTPTAPLIALRDQCAVLGHRYNDIIDEIISNKKQFLAIRSGAVKFDWNTCTILQS